MSQADRWTKTATPLFLLLVLAPLCWSQANGNDEHPGNKLVCYAELWAGGRPSPADYDLSALPAENCDLLVLTYVTLDAETWALRLYSGYGEVDPDDFRTASRLRSKNPSLKVLLSVGGWADGVRKYSDMISERDNRKAFIESVVQMLSDYSLDGLELHWLYPGVVSRGGRAGDKENFAQLVKELNTAFKPENWTLAASVPPDADTLRGGFNVARLNRELHQLHLRTLDMRGDWTKFASGHCPLYSSCWEKPELSHLNVNDSISLWLTEGASPQKLLPTFPFYGRSFTLKNSKKSEAGSPIVGAGPQTPLLMARGLMAYFEICDALQNGRLRQGYQSQAETPYAVKGELWVGYDDEESLEKKVKLLTERRLGGAAVFAVSLDDFAGTCGESHFLLRKTRALLDEDLPFLPDPRKKP